MSEAKTDYRNVILTIERAYRICKRDAKMSEDLSPTERFCFNECKAESRTPSALTGLIRDVKWWCSDNHLWGKFKEECEFLKHEFQDSYNLVHSIILELDKKSSAASSADSRQTSKE